MEIEIRKLTPELEQAYFDFFDHRAFSDGSPYYPCYCNAFNMPAKEIADLHEKAKLSENSAEAWKNVLRESAVKMVREGKIRGYLAFDHDKAIAWCNTNDRISYCRVGEFDLDHVTEDSSPSESLCPGEIKSIVCFAVSPEYRGKGIASRLLNRIIEDAAKEGYRYVEVYPSVTKGSLPAFTGPLRLYEKAGFTVCEQTGAIMIMRRPLSAAKPEQ